MFLRFDIPKPVRDFMDFALREGVFDAADIAVIAIGIRDEGFLQGDEGVCPIRWRDSVAYNATAVVAARRNLPEHFESNERVLERANTLLAWNP